MRQIIFDTETTGLSPKQGHRVIEIGCVEMINRRLTGEHFHVYINPEREVEAEALAVHGITNKFLADKPIFTEVAQDFFGFVEGAELIAHNATFDVGFLNHELRQAVKGFKQLEDHCQIFDTLKLARRMHPGQRNNLDALTKRYHIEHFNRELHGALLDAEILAQVYLAMTGGQAALFGEAAQSDSVEESADAAVSRNRVPLPVITAAQEELAEHQKMLALLEKSAEEQIVGWE